MLFSILIAHYNNWDYFQDCYKSIQNQTYQNIEIIIVDDCSTDSSFSRLENLAKSNSRIKLYRNEENRGVGFTKATCIEKASGEIMGFLDPDDALVNNAIEKSIAQYKNKNTIATYSKIQWCDENLNSLYIYPKSKKIKNNNPYFFNINNEVSHFFTFKKEAYNNTVGINCLLSSAVDFDMYLKLYEQGHFYFIRKPLYQYRQHTGGVSQNKQKKSSVRDNWNQVLIDTCKRRNITKIGDHIITEEQDLAKIIFEKENTWLAKIIRKFN